MPVRRTHGSRTDTMKSLVTPSAECEDPALDRLQAVNVVVDIGEQGLVAQLLEPDVFDEGGNCELALIERSGTDRENAAGAADTANAWVVRGQPRLRQWPWTQPRP